MVFWVVDNLNLSKDNNTSPIENDYKFILAKFKVFSLLKKECRPTWATFFYLLVLLGYTVSESVIIVRP